MALDDLHRHVARIALAAVGRKYDVALAGGNALMVHEVVSRHTEDVDYVGCQGVQLGTVS